MHKAELSGVLELNILNPMNSGHIWIFPFVRNFSFGAVPSADEKHVSAQQIVMHSQIPRNATQN